MSLETGQNTDERRMKPLTVRPGEVIHITIMGEEAPKPEIKPVLRSAEKQVFPSHGELRKFTAQYGQRLLESRTGSSDEKFGDSPDEIVAMEKIIHGLRRDGVSDEEARSVITREAATWQNGTIDRGLIADFSFGVVDEINSYAEKYLPIDDLTS